MMPTQVLRVNLPQTWRVTPPGEAVSEQVSGVLAPLMRRALDPAMGDPDKPDLTAATFEVLNDDAGEFLGIVLAGMAGRVRREGESLVVAPDSSVILRDVEIAAGKSADFYVLSLSRAVGPDRNLVDLTFSTPNLPWIEPLDALFRQIASTVSLVVV